MRDVLLFLHIAGVAGWIGGGMFGIYAGGQLAKAGGESGGRALEIIYERATVYYGTVFVLVVGSGVGLVLSEDAWGWGDTFIWIGIGAIVLSGIWEGLFGRTSGETLIKELKASGTASSATVKKWRFVGWADIAILLVAVWAMVTKIGA